jgi:anthranilate synthase component 1
VWQAQARIIGQRQRSYSPLDTIAACFPAGSVTGAPKLRAMEIIHELEPYPRHVYCGAIGYITAKGNAQFSVAIRTALVCAGQLYYYVGSGITSGSNSVNEWAELKQKYAVLK